MKLGDLVKPGAAYPQPYSDSGIVCIGIVVEVDVDMWPECSDEPSGVTVLWPQDGKEDVYEDEVETLDENA